VPYGWRRTHAEIVGGRMGQRLSSAQRLRTLPLPAFEVLTSALPL
jgi:hypothetical protein